MRHHFLHNNWKSFRHTYGWFQQKYHHTHLHFDTYKLLLLHYWQNSYKSFLRIDSSGHSYKLPMRHRNHLAQYNRV